MRSLFGSTHVREVVGPDRRNFNDFAATIPVLTFGELVPGPGPMEQGDEQVIVANWWIQARDPTEGCKNLAAELHPLIVYAFGDLGSKIVANIALPDEAGMLEYFTENAAPVYLRAIKSTSTEKSQRAGFLDKMAKLEERTADVVVDGGDDLRDIWCSVRGI